MGTRRTTAQNTLGIACEQCRRNSDSRKAQEYREVEAESQEPYRSPDASPLEGHTPKRIPTQRIGEFEIIVLPQKLPQQMTLRGDGLGRRRARVLWDPHGCRLHHGYSGPKWLQWKIIICLENDYPSSLALHLTGPLFAIPTPNQHYTIPFQPTKMQGCCQAMDARSTSAPSVPVPSTSN